MAEINNERAFELTDQDPEVFAQAFTEALEVIAKHFKKIAVGNEIITEVGRQEEEWGEQDHPLFPDALSADSFRAVYQHRAEQWQTTNGYRQTVGKVGWDGILLEEVYEALAEADPEKREVELVQVAAVCVSMILASRRARAV